MVEERGRGEGIPVGLCVLPKPPKHRGRSVEHPHYAQEIFSHAGLCYATVSQEELPDVLPSLEVLITVGEAELPEALRRSLRDWVEQGGAWIAVGGVCGLPGLFGVDIQPPAYTAWNPGFSVLGEGYLEAIDQAHPILAHLEIPLHFFNGLSVRASGGNVLAEVRDAHQREDSRAAVVEMATGKGRCLLIAPDVTGTIVRIQQGTAVTRDGISAPDGTAPLGEGVLKCDDGMALDWIFDRRPVEGIEGFQAFLQPIADQWRELLLRAVFYLAQRRGTPLPLLWLYPRNLPALGHLSNDTDLNEPDKAEHLLAVLKRAGVHSTWCVIPPGYPPALIRAIREAGHDLAMHYNALEQDGKEWSREEFDRQFLALVDLFEGAAPVVNKNHYTLWQGDTECFEWCAGQGIELDQSKGPSKSGETGFLFGTCHPYFPVASGGECIDVLELPMHTQDLVVTAPPKLADALLPAVLKSHGVMHLVFHPNHILKEGVEASLIGALDEAKQQGLEWWTAARINRWERARRAIAWKSCARDPRRTQVVLETRESLDEATILWLMPRPEALEVDGQRRKFQGVQRWGFPFYAVALDARKGAEYVLSAEPAC